MSDDHQEPFCADRADRGADVTTSEDVTHEERAALLRSLLVERYRQPPAQVGHHESREPAETAAPATRRRGGRR